MNFSDIRDVQLKELRKLLAKVRYTAFGKAHKLENVNNYEAFTEALPVSRYAYFHPWIERAKSGEADIIWPGVVDKYSVSSGTTGSGKHIPVTAERLASDKAFMRRVVRSCLQKLSNFSVVNGRHLSLPGTIEQHTCEGNSIQIGEISGFLGTLTPWYLKPLQLIPGEALVRLSWEEKFRKVLRKALKSDIRVINAAPPWLLILFQNVLEMTGKSSIQEVWPNLKVIVCGGVALSNYISTLNKLTYPLIPQYVENYGASEGYFAFSKIVGEDLKLVPDNGVFYEFVPADENDKVDYENTTPIPVWEVEAGKRYGLLISSNSGLWRYIINDLVEITGTNPLTLKVAGRTSGMLDDFGEALSHKEAYQAMQKACKEHHAGFSVFSICASFESKHSQPNHCYFVTWNTPPSNTEKFAYTFDNELQGINRHYSIRRKTNAIGLPQFFSINYRQLTEWVTGSPEITQTKIPEIIHDKEKARRILKMVEKVHSS